jgi:energy-coupling factor transporter ATP-binding protein EcfA2
VLFYETPFLRENLDDITLALGLGRPVFLLGPAGSGKSMLADRVALLLARRYGVARVEGRAGLSFDDVVAACRLGFTTDAWKALATGDDPAGDPVRPGDNLLIVDQAEAVPPVFIEQLVAASSGASGRLPSHRILFVGREDLAGLIETGQVRNHRGAPVEVHVEPWHGDVVVPFLRHRLGFEGLCEPDLLSEATIREIAAEANGNPGRMIEFARRALQPAARHRPAPVDPAVAAPPPVPRPATVLKLAAVEKPAPVVIAEPRTAAPALALRPIGDLAAPHPAVAPRRFMRVGLPVTAMIAAAALIWMFDRPDVLNLLVPQQVAVAAAPVPAPVSVATPGPAATPEPVVTPAAVETTPEPAVIAAAAPIAATPALPPAVASPAVQANAAPVAATPAPPPAAAPPAVQTVATPVVEPLAAAGPIQTSNGPPPTPTVPTPVVAQAPAAPAMPAEALIGRGDDLLANGDFAAARSFYLQAAKAGSAKAATAVARTYDPAVLTQLGVVGARGEPDKAAEWYRRAVELGDQTAGEPLRRLAPP